MPLEPTRNMAELSHDILLVVWICSCLAYACMTLKAHYTRRDKTDWGPFYAPLWPFYAHELELCVSARFLVVAKWIWCVAICTGIGWAAMHW